MSPAQTAWADNMNGRNSDDNLENSIIIITNKQKSKLNRYWKTNDYSFMESS